METTASTSAASSAFGAVEITILWGETVMCVAHPCPVRAYFVGTNDPWDDAAVACKLALPAEAIGARRAALVDVNRAGKLEVLVPPGATLELTSPGKSPRSRRDAVEAGITRPYPGIQGALRLGLARGERVQVASGAFVFDIASVDAAEAASPFPRLEARPVAWAIASAALHLGLLLVFAFLLPSLIRDGQDGVGVEPVAMLSYVLVTTAERDVAAPDPSMAGGDAPIGAAEMTSPGGARAMGAVVAPTGNRYGVRGPADNPDPHVGRSSGDGEQPQDVIGVPKPRSGDTHTPIAPWGRDDSLGNDGESARGNMWGGEIDESFGVGGLGLGGEGDCGCGATASGFPIAVANEPAVRLASTPHLDAIAVPVQARARVVVVSRAPSARNAVLLGGVAAPSGG